MKRVIILLLFLSGCYSPVTNVRHLLPKRQQISKHETVDSIKKYYFTKEAYKAIKDIPAVDGITYNPWVTGVNFWSNLLGIITLNGVSRKVVLSADSIKGHGISLFIHEYIHHLDDMDRDGEGEWIDHKEWLEAYKRMSDDNQYIEVSPGNYIKIYRYPHIIKEVEQRADRWITNVFGIGYLSEHIAYLGQLLVKRNGPDYMWKVYRKILKRHR